MRIARSSLRNARLCRAQSSDGCAWARARVAKPSRLLFGADGIPKLLRSAGGVCLGCLALLCSYMTTSFVTAADGNRGTLVTDASQTSNRQPLLTQLPLDDVLTNLE